MLDNGGVVMIALLPVVLTLLSVKFPNSTTARTGPMAAHALELSLANWAVRVVSTGENRAVHGDIG